MNSTEPTDTTQGSRRSRKHFWTGLFFGTLGIVVVVVAVLFFVLLGVATEAQKSSTTRLPSKEALGPFEYCIQNYPSPRFTTEENSECVLDVFRRPNRRYPNAPSLDDLRSNPPTPTPPSSNI